MGFFNFFNQYNNKAKVRNFDEEYASEISINASNTNLGNSYSYNGVLLDTTSNKGRLKYSGILAESGADGVIAVIDYGSNDHWDNVHYYPMSKTGSRSYELHFPIEANKSINLVFKDTANGWDNNSGQNYTFNEGSH